MSSNSTTTLPPFARRRRARGCCLQVSFFSSLIICHEICGILLSHNQVSDHVVLNRTPRMGMEGKYTYMHTHCKQESTRDVNVENPEREKPREPTDSKLSLCQKNTTGGIEATTSCSLSSPGGGYNRESLCISLSLSLLHSVQQLHQ